MTYFDNRHWDLMTHFDDRHWGLMTDFWGDKSCKVTVNCKYKYVYELQKENQSSG